MVGTSPLDAVEVKYGEQLLPVIRKTENSADDAVSPKGAIGRYQIMPGTARQYGFDPKKLSDPMYNERVAGHILNDLHRRFKDPSAVLVAYNAGPTVARRWLDSGKAAPIPAETQKYLANSERYLQAGGQPLPPRNLVADEYVTDFPARGEPPKMAPGAAELDRIQKAGFSADEIEKYRQSESQKFIKAGFTPNEIDAYWGVKDLDPAQMNAHTERKLSSVPADSAPMIAKNPMDAFAAGWDMSVAGLLANQSPPKTVLPENAGTAAKVLAGTGQLVGDLPTAAAGLFAGAGAGSELGPVGAIAGGGAGSAMLPQAMREIMLDYYKRGEIRTSSDFMAMAAHSVWNTAKAGIVGAVTAPLGFFGGKAAGVVAGNAGAIVADTGIQVTTGATLNAAMEGKLPDADDFIVAGVTAAVPVAAHAAMRGGKVTPAAKMTAEKMEGIYRETGIPPWDLAQKMQTDRVLKGEILSEDPSGAPVIPKLRESISEPEPFAPPPKVEIIEPVPEEDGGGALVPPNKPPPGAGGPDDITPPGGPKPTKLEGKEPLTPEMLNEIAGEFIGEDKVKDSLLDPSRNYRQWISELGPARAIDKILLDQGFDRDRQMGLEDMFRQTYASDTRTGYFVQKGALDPITLEPKLRQNPETGEMVPVPPIKAAVAKVKETGGNLRDWLNYMVAERANKLEDRSLEHGHPLDRGQRDQLLAAGQGKYAEASGMLQQLTDAGLDYGKDSGIFSSQQVEAMRRDNPMYVSFRRISGDESQPPKQTRGRGFRVREPVSRYEGDDGRIRNPLLATVDNINQIIRMADRNRAIGSAITLAERHGLLEELGLKQVGKPEVKMSIAEPGSKVFKPYDVNAGEPYEPFLAARAMRGQFKPNQFMYIRDGKPELWEATDEALATLLRGADTPNEAVAIVTLAQKVAGLQRAGIVSAADFPIRNSMRDQINAFIMDPHSPPPFLMFMRGAMDAFKQSDNYWRWVGKGGAGSALVEMDLNRVDRSVNEVFEKTGTYNKMWNVVRHPLEAMQMLSERIDSASRIGYAKGLEADGIDSIKAATMGRKAMLDFVEKGTSAFVQGWARATPFMRPTLLSYKQFGEAITSNPGGVLLKTLAAVTVPTMVFYALNWMQDKYGGLPEDEQFKNLPRYYKDGMYILPQVGGVRLRLPYPPIVGPLFGGMTTRFLDHFANEDPEAFEKWSHTILAQFVPPFVPSIVLPPLEHLANKNFFTGHPLMPASLEGASGPMQYTENTTAPAKKLSQVVASIGVDVSPIVIENYARQWSGSLGMAALKALDAPFKEGGKPWEMADVPFVGSFLIRNPGMSAQPIQDFFEARKEFSRWQKDMSLAKKRAMLGNTEEIDTATELPLPPNAPDNIADSLMNMQVVVRAINADKTMTDDEKRQFTDDIYGNMIELSKGGLEVMRQIKKQSQQ